MWRLVVELILLSYIAQNSAIILGHGQYPNIDEIWNSGMSIRPVNPSTNACPIKTLLNIDSLPVFLNHNNTMTSKLNINVPKAKN